MPRVEDAYQACARQVHQAGSSFYYGIRLLPPAKRNALYAVYAWSRICDDAVDDYEGEEAQRRLQAAADLYDRASGEGWAELEDPLGVAMGDAIRRFHLSDAPFRGLIEGMKMDLTRRRYETFADLEDYCQHVAGTVGVLCVEIFGFKDARARTLAVQLGVALQLTNIIRDLREDVGRGRLYLPRETLQTAGISPEEAMERPQALAWANTLARIGERARGYYRGAGELFDLIEPDSQACLQLLYDVYFRLLQKMEKIGYDVWTRQVRVSRHEKLGMIGRVLWHQANG